MSLVENQEKTIQEKTIQEKIDEKCKQHYMRFLRYPTQLVLGYKQYKQLMQVMINSGKTTHAELQSFLGMRIVVTDNPYQISFGLTLDDVRSFR